MMLSDRNRSGSSLAMTTVAPLRPIQIATMSHFQRERRYQRSSPEYCRPGNTALVPFARLDPLADQGHAQRKSDANRLPPVGQRHQGIELLYGVPEIVLV